MAYRTVPCCTVPHCTVPYCTALYRTAIYRTIFYRTVPYCTFNGRYMIILSSSFLKVVSKEAHIRYTALNFTRLKSVNPLLFDLPKKEIISHMNQTWFLQYVASATGTRGALLAEHNNKMCNYNTAILNGVTNCSEIFYNCFKPKDRVTL